MGFVNIGPETEQIEYKKSTGELKEGVISIVSILNKHGSGELYFGVKDDGTVIGQEIGAATKRTVSQAIGNHIKPAIYPEIDLKQFGDRVTVHVKFSGSRQPYLAYNIPRIRVADEDLVMDQDLYGDLLRQREDRKRTWESQTSGYTVDDVDDRALNKYLLRAKKAGRITFDTDDKELVLKRLRLTNGRYLLNAGAALFCNTDINELKLAKFASNERLTFTDIRLCTGSIIELADTAEQYISDAMDWSAEIVGYQRVETPEIPVEAIREAVINSFAHRIVESGQSNEIAIFKNRIEIYSYGTFPAHLTPEQYIVGDEQPVRRNPLIAATLYYSKDMENFATGLKRISWFCRKAGCRVEFQRKPAGFCVVFYRRGYENPEQNSVRNTGRKGAEVTSKTEEMWSRSAEDAPDSAEVICESAEDSEYSAVSTQWKQDFLLDYGIESKVGRVLVESVRAPMSEQQLRVYQYILKNGSITTVEAAVLLNVKERRARAVLKDMVSAHIIKKIGATNKTKYMISSEEV